MAISSFSFINIGSILLLQHNTTHNDDSTRRLLYILKIIFKLICEKATTTLNIALAFCLNKHMGHIKKKIVSNCFLAQSYFKTSYLCSISLIFDLLFGFTVIVGQVFFSPKCRAQFYCHFFNVIFVGSLALIQK